MATGGAREAVAIGKYNDSARLANRQNPSCT